MISEKLQKAREYESQYMSYVKPEDRPSFHVTGGIGWINDPNGFCEYKGEYHLFFQYHPYSTHWGPMHWGHVKTKDFVKWERLPIAIAPDMEYDSIGCFSGSAIELADGRMLLLYTGVYSEKGEDGLEKDIQHQCVAIGDGIDFEKIDINPVIDRSNLPEGGSIVDFRDPKIWKENGKYYAVVGNRTDDGSGSVLMYESEDGFSYKYKGMIDRCYNEYGKMWECPDFFKLDTEYVLMTSPQEMRPIGMEFHAGDNTMFLTGSFDYDTVSFERKHVQAVDHGLDFYAPQTLLTSDGRRIMIAWMQNWATSNCQVRDCRIFGQMTFPRELTMKDGKILQNPVKEIENYRGRKVVYEDVLVKGVTTLPGIQGRKIDMTVTVRPIKENSYEWFKLNVAKDGENVSMIRYKPSTQTVRIDRSRSGSPHDIVHSRDFLVYPKNEEIKLRVLMDKNSVEVFVNDGEQAATMVIYTDISAQAITFDAEGEALITVEKYELNME